MSNRGKALDKLPARQGVPWTILRLRGDRTGEEQPYWLKTVDPVALYVTLCYGLYQGGVDSGWKLVLKIFRPENGEPRLHARLMEHHSADQAINAITEEHNDENGKTSFSLPAGEISFLWHGGRPCIVRLEKHVPMLEAPPARPALPGVSEENTPPVHTFEVEDAKNHIDRASNMV
ncbi:hypothetical protein WJX73_003574 [Symbiochloris irregularis]|uniref:Uncharacterized protein n=1 Tax=Symbiochloris irregularis TaxID=706552 RepID=A0AAW1P845_9CHLO